MNIKHFESEFSYTILQRGHTYFKKKKLKEITCDDNGNYRFVVAGTYNYNVTASITPEGEISGLSCDCPYDRGYCKHIAAALIYLDSIFDESISNRGSKYTGLLIQKYTQLAEISTQERGIRLVPELVSSYEGLKFSLKIGR